MMKEKKCPCNKDNGRYLWIECNNEDCEIKWWHARCAGLKEITRNQVEAVGKWCCPLCTVQSLNIPVFGNNANNVRNNDLVWKIDEKLVALKSEIEDLKVIKENFDTINKNHQKELTAMKENFGLLDADQKDGDTTKADKNITFASAVASHVVQQSNKQIFDRETREKNVIIFKAQEFVPKQSVEPGDSTIPEITSDDRKSHDNNIINAIYNCLDIEKPQLEKVLRIGTPSSDKVRPMKVTFSTVFDKRKFLANLYKLGEAPEECIIKSIQVQHDLSPEERKHTKLLLKEAHEKNENENPVNFLYKVRGPPGAIQIVKVYKKKPKN